jgi:diguanylate cyclase (GGDEF)-like protein
MLIGLPALARFFRCDEIHVLERTAAPTLAILDHSWNRILGVRTRNLRNNSASDEFLWRVGNTQHDVALIHQHSDAFPSGWSEALSAPLAGPDGYLGRLLLVRTGHDREPWAATDMASLSHSAKLLAGVMSQYRLLHDLERVVLQDALTGLTNEAGLLKILENEMLVDDRQRAGLLYIDVNHFKEINDRLGHDAGDQALRVVAERIRRVIKSSDVAVRLHGDEFAVLVRDLNQLNHLQAVAERIGEVISDPTELPDPARVLSASIGGVYQLPPDRRLGGVLKLSDHLMYEVKRNGGGVPMVSRYLDAYRLAASVDARRG